MRFIVVLLGLLGASCVGTTRPHGATRTTGTCQGACSHYAQCKRGIDDTTYTACLTECTDSLGESPRSLREFERLSCADAVAFIEGASGREPGAPML